MFLKNTGTGTEGVPEVERLDVDPLSPLDLLVEEWLEADKEISQHVDPEVTTAVPLRLGVAQVILATGPPSAGVLGPQS